MTKMSLFSSCLYIRVFLPMAVGIFVSTPVLLAQDQPVELKAPQTVEVDASLTDTPESNSDVTVAPSELSTKKEGATKAERTTVEEVPTEQSASEETTVKVEKVPVKPESPVEMDEENSEPALDPVQETKEPKKIVHDDPLLNKVEQAIDLSRRRYLTATIHTPWQIMHGILSYREEFELNRDGNSDEKINGIKFISNDPVYQGEHWFQKTPHGGKAHPFTVPYAFEGHPNQFPAIMTMTDLPITHEFKTADGSITMQDIVRNAQMEVNNHEGQTWTLWFLTHYLPSDTEWKNARGENWSIERLVQMQNQVVVERAACGGCHNLLALSIARNNHLQEGGQLRGVWLEANQKILRYTEIARRTQNRDGSFSSEYFRSPQFSNEFKRRIATSGHILEFLMVALPQSRLKEQWVRNAVNNVSNDLIRFGSQPADVGALYHAVDSLVIYRDRVVPREVASSTSDENITVSGTKESE